MESINEYLVVGDNIDENNNNNNESTTQQQQDGNVHFNLTSNISDLDINVNNQTNSPSSTSNVSFVTDSNQSITSTSTVPTTTTSTTSTTTTPPTTTTSESVVVESTEDKIKPIKWNIVPTSNNPTPRFDNTLVQYQGYLYLFGGSEVGSEMKSAFSHFQRLYLDTMAWQSLPCTTVTSRVLHTAIVHENAMYIYGGGIYEDEKSSYFWSSNTKKLFKTIGSLLKFDFLTNEWTTLGEHQPRDGHSSVVVGDNIYVMGGSQTVYQKGSIFSVFFNTTEVYNITTNKWRQINSPQFGRLGAAASYGLSEDKKFIYYFGGYDQSGRSNNDLWRLNLETETWRLSEQFAEFQSMLRYIYSGDETIVTLDNCIPLLHLSDLYMIDRLKTICEAKAIEGIEFDTVVALYKQADFYKLSSLRQTCVTYIAKNHKDVLATGTLNDVDSSFLLEIMYCLDPSLNQKSNDNQESSKIVK
ncbi:hypothetical protein PPL_00934 [Heterostelium album PN500]|uniref:BTB domain-containing protein n=1 Tax=Heterostelium pallidum (strain ATCC 26659 / Pp 5 / PN500) TaxID=670386 RepID=D3AXM8_HETP5|nr:hypothetical protein PPL_00934 [Heterostelium album PN500]EFA85705.1 hypothetical protein PPL_00934 [Heterostelium album PN500]|eukprot:XP_020437811.1 hypothetical protein PPL_00934 [Heterostelium album PN500]